MISLFEDCFGTWEILDSVWVTNVAGVVGVKQHSITKRKKGCCNFRITGLREIPVERAVMLIEEWRNNVLSKHEL